MGTAPFLLSIIFTGTVAAAMPNTWRKIDVPSIPTRHALRTISRTVPDQGTGGKKRIPRVLPVVIIEEGNEHIFSVQVEIENMATRTKITYQTRTGPTPPRIGSGIYRILTETSRKGFPQEARYEIVDVHTEKVVRAYPKTHVSLSNVSVADGEQLHIVILPATRPYNASFFRLGPRRFPAAILFVRPYPSQDFEPGTFHGKEQFNSAQMALAFWGAKRAREQPALASSIRSIGVRIPQTGEFVHDPTMVLGAREVAADLAQAFIRERNTAKEDYRGKHHVSFLFQRKKDGGIPQFLASISQEQLAPIFEEHLLWMLRHNVHRPQEGGGYAGKSFADVFAEAQEKVQQWPEVSRQSTELLAAAVYALETLVETRGLDGEHPDGSGPLRDLLSSALLHLINAARREKMNAATYAPEELENVRENLDMSISERTSALDNTIERSLGILRTVDPGHAREVE